MADTELHIGTIAKTAGVSVQTLHYYERIGLLQKPHRSSGNYRLYAPHALRRVLFIKKAQAVGLTLDEIKNVLEVKDHGKPPCRKVAEMAEERLAEIDANLAKLRAFRRGLVAVLPQWKKETAVERVCAGEFCDLIERLP